MTRRYGGAARRVRTCRRGGPRPVARRRSRPLGGGVRPRAGPAIVRGTFGPTACAARGSSAPLRVPRAVRAVRVPARDPTLPGWLHSRYYKGPACRRARALPALPGDARPTTLVHLGYGEAVWLCAQHASPEFRRSRAGRDLAPHARDPPRRRRAPSRRRSRALDRFLATDAYADPGRPARAPARTRGPTCAAPSRSSAAAAASRSPARRTRARPRCAAPSRPAGRGCPSARTLRRWRAERRWELPGWRAPDAPAAGR